MGNRLGSRRHAVDDKYTRPQGLYQHIYVDRKKLRRLILDSKLAPCFPGGDDRVHDLEECPICFLYYPSLNRSRCCMKGICTECFLLLKTPNSSIPTQCPFCKTSNYAVEYRGVKSKEEKGMEQIEEQRVIEARIRMRQQEINEEEERAQKRDCRISKSGSIEEDEAECISVSASSGRILQELVPFSLQHQIPQQNGDEDTDLDIEDVMVMEAIWRSIQKKGYSDNEEAIVESAPEESPSPDPYRVVSDTFGCAAAALAELQHAGGSTSSSSSPNMCAAKTPTPCIADSWSEATPSYRGGYISEFENIGAAFIPESFEERMMVAEVMSLTHLNQSGRF